MMKFSYKVEYLKTVFSLGGIGDMCYILILPGVICPMPYGFAQKVTFLESNIKSRGWNCPTSPYIGPTNEDLYLDTPEFTMPKHGKTVCGSSVGSPYG